MAAPIFLIRRDIAILVMVHSFGGCTAEQVARRRFSTLKGLRVCYRRLAKLINQGYLSCRRLPAMTGVGSGKNFLTVTPRGRLIAAAVEGISVSDLTRSRTNAPRFIEHHLAIGDTRIAFEQAAERSPLFSMLEWRGDRQLFIRVDAEEADPGRNLAPDSSFILALANGGSQMFYLEQDTGSLTNRSRMRARLHGYLVSARTSHVPVLFVTTTNERLTALAELVVDAAKLEALSPQVVWLTTTERLALNDALHGRVWQVVGVSELQAIADALRNPLAGPHATQRGLSS